MEDVLINKRSYFEEKTIEKMKTEFKFSQSRHIEMLLWDFEIFAQIVSMNQDFVLKGGAATQIYLPVDKQRASRDIDFATTLSREEIEATLDKIKKKFEAHSKGDEHFTWQRVPSPRESNKRIEDLHCYDIVVPTRFGQSLGKKGASNLRIDAIRYETLPFKVTDAKTPSIFNLTLKPFPIISEGSLIADKLLTLADTTVGILAIREDYESYLKQIYDLSHLISLFGNDVKVIKDIIMTLEKLTPIELKYRNLTKSLKDVLNDIINSLEKRKYFDFDTSESAKDFRDRIKDFQANYLNKSEWLISQAWAVRISKIRLFSEIIHSCLEKKMTFEGAGSLVNKLAIAETKLNSLKGDELRKMQSQLISFFKGDNKTARQMKYAQPIRIFYGVISKDNAEPLLKSL